MKFIKIFFYNLLVLFFAFISIEIIFGYWFDKDNLGPYMREHRMKKNFYSLKYYDQTYDYVYKRNYYGFRGEEINLKNIKAVMIGGSPCLLYTSDAADEEEEVQLTKDINLMISQ